MAFFLTTALAVAGCKASLSSEPASVTLAISVEEGGAEPGLKSSGSLGQRSFALDYSYTDGRRSGWT